MSVETKLLFVIMLKVTAARHRLATAEVFCRASCVRCCVLKIVFGFNYKIMINI
jgi:hypothetical protein